MALRTEGASLDGERARLPSREILHRIVTGELRMRVWRVFPARFRDAAFSGDQGLHAAGRWNKKGVPMVYTSGSRELAALEFFRNLDEEEARDELLIAEAAVPDELIELVDLGALPSDWCEGKNTACRDLGTEWASSRRSAALRVPSAAVEREWNVLLNPRHPDFAKVEVFAPEEFRFDAQRSRG